jgi:hypothetical protein
MLVQLMYASTMSDGLSETDFASMARRSAASNAQVGITGVLLSNGMHFVQVLEGHPKEVNALYNKIARDPRHFRVELLGYLPLRHRQYGNWAMTLIPFDVSAIREEWSDTLPSSFSPYDLDNVGVHLLVSKAHARIMLKRYREDRLAQEQT